MAGRRTRRHAISVPWAGLACLAGGTTAASNALTVYYPFCLVELLAFRESDDVEETGESLVTFLDADGCQVTLRLSPHAVDALRKRMPYPPDTQPK